MYEKEKIKDRDNDSVIQMSERDFEKIKAKMMTVPGMTEKEAHVLAMIRSTRHAEQNLEADGMSREEFAELRWSGMQKCPDW